MISIIQDNLGLSIVGAAIVGILLLIWNIFLHLNVRRIKKSQQQFFSGKNGADLEKTILEHAKNVKELDRDIQDLYGISNQIHGLASKSIHKVGIVRFNPFKDLGGDQSFSVAFLDGENTGVVISSLHTREGNRVYSKPVEKGKAVKYPLTEEEKKAIRRADAGGSGAGKKA